MKFTVGLKYATRDFHAYYDVVPDFSTATRPAYASALRGYLRRICEYKYLYGLT